ncbi:UNVERIFIED_CONTAM: hypothetical protein FKN15_036791 [Acipenser sinensis]
MEKIKEGEADAVTLDRGDIYSAGRCYGLVPAAGECYKNNESLIYYAVAVANKLQDISMETLSNMSSCHSGMKRTAGWVVPVGFLVNRNIITVCNCDFAGAVGSLFKQSCIPGIKDLQYNPLGTNPQNLCEGCSGGGQRVCRGVQLPKTLTKAIHSSQKRFGDNAGGFQMFKSSDHGDKDLLFKEDPFSIYNIFWM